MPVVTLTKSNSVTQDTFVYQAAPSGTNGSLSTLQVGTGSASNQVYRSMIKFDLGLIPNDAIINSATLMLNEINTSSLRTIGVHKITSSWDNNTSWNTQPTFDSTPSTTFSAGTATGAKNIDVKQLVQDWVSGTSVNNGLLLKDTNEATLNTYIQFGSFDNATPANNPTLTIDYTIPTTGKKQVEYLGNGGVKEGSNTTAIYPTLPTGLQTGDLLIMHVGMFNNNSITIPSGWTQAIQTSIGTSWRYAVFYKKHSSVDPPPTVSFSGSSTASAIISAYRNVKDVVLGTGTVYTASVASFAPPPFTVTSQRTMFVLLNMVGGSGYTTPPLSYTETYDVGNCAIQSSYRYMHSSLAQTSAEMTSRLTSGTSGGASYVLALEPLTNNPPTLALTSPANNQTLAEGNSYPVEGTASDADSGNVVTVKYQINNGPVRALQSGVSDGSTPISFARNLVYRNKRIWDGSIDVAGVDLAENTDHTFKVWSEDDQGGKSAEVTRNFRVIHNRPPVISGSNEDLGTIMVPPTKTYTVTEPEANPFTVTEKINGTVIRSFPGVAGRDETVTIPHDLWIRLDLDTPHTLTVEATDSQGMMSTRTFIFIRTETHIEFLLNFDNPAVAAHFTPDGMPKRVLVTLERYLPPGASIESVKVCNNALDAEPTWEDATAAVVAGRGYLFTNQTKTADNWRINIWVVIAKGTATERVRLDGLGGAFD